MFTDQPQSRRQYFSVNCSKKCLCFIHVHCMRRLKLVLGSRNDWLGEKVNLLGTLLSQSGRPRGWFGRILVRGMNLGHSGLTRWGLSKVEFPEHANVLDIGCGGGRTLEHLASLVRLGKAVGIDYSEDSVAVAWKTDCQRSR